ncbi:MAG: YcbK family protein [Polyangiaceae bacterium]
MTRVRRAAQTRRLLARAGGTALLVLLAAAPGHADEPPPARPSLAVPARVAKPVIPAGYFHTVRQLHMPAPGQKILLDDAGRPMLVLHALYVRETVSLRAASDEGGFVASDLDRAARALRDPSTGDEHPIDPRTVDILYRIQRRFSATEIRVISGYRTPNAHSSQGLHGKGRAVDFVVPGATDQDVARFARELGFVGVGVYPAGSFVHVDVRERSYFWVDRSGPGHRSRERGILLDVARRSDAAARARGETPARSAGIGDDVDHGVRAVPSTAVSAGKEEDEGFSP